jgi:RNA polymerase sigma factor (sigma-70 family)
MRYVVKRAKDFEGSKAALEDLIQAGNEGLVQAADKFDASLGVKFLSFASYYIDNEIRKTASNHKKHHCGVSLDAPLYPDSNGEEVVADGIESDRSHAADWNMRLQNALDVMKKGVDKRWYKGAGELLEDYIRMKMKGLTDDDFMKTNRLDRDRMASFLDMVREEGNKVLKEQWQDCMVEIPNITARL